MNSDIWSVFHDGEISSIAALMPQNLVFGIRHPTLIKQFSPSGDRKYFEIIISHCDLFAFKDFDDDQIVTNPSSLQNRTFEILSAQLQNGLLTIITVEGSISLRYGEEVVRLEKGPVVTLAELHEAADRAMHAGD